MVLNEEFYENVNFSKTDHETWKRFKLSTHLACVKNNVMAICTSMC